MNKLKIIFLLVGFIITFQCLVPISNNRLLYESSVFGQTDSVLDVRNNKKVCKKSIKNLYSGSINIIEKYLTIYMILFIFSYYIKSVSIRR